MSKRHAFGDERDHCINCTHSIEYCESPTTACRWTEAVDGKPHRRRLGANIYHFEGVRELVDERLRYGVSNYGQ